jgi:magnesium-transporting ATPase (P-type)
MQLPPWSNRWLIGAIVLSMVLHCFILYVPAAASVFSVAPLSSAEWVAVLWLSFPVIILDECLKYVSRCAPPSWELPSHHSRTWRR